MRSQYPYIGEQYKDYLLKFYDVTIMPTRVERAGKASYVERNQEMIDASDFCIFYYIIICHLSVKKQRERQVSINRKAGHGLHGIM